MLASKSPREQQWELKFPVHPNFQCTQCSLRTVSHTGRSGCKEIWISCSSSFILLVLPLYQSTGFITLSTHFLCSLGVSWWMLEDTCPPQVCYQIQQYSSTVTFYTIPFASHPCNLEISQELIHTVAILFSFLSYFKRISSTKIEISLLYPRLPWKPPLFTTSQFHLR